MTYLRAMKKFQKETRAILPDSPEYKNVRNEIYRGMLSKRGADATALKNKKGDSVVVNENFAFNPGSFYNLLIVIPEEVDCYETMNVLNYYGFPFHIEEDNTFRQGNKLEMGFSKEDYYPVMMIDSSTAEMPPADLIQKDHILSHLHNLGLIGSHKSHSAFEKQGLQAMYDGVEVPLADVFTEFRPHMQFYLQPKHFF